VVGSQVRIGSSLHSNKQVVGQGSNWGGGKTRHTSGKTLIPRQHHGNWDHNEVLALIVYKHAKHATKLPKSCRRKPKSIIQEVEQCVKTSGMHSISTTKN
jgi:hypothetical protein